MIKSNFIHQNSHNLAIRSSLHPFGIVELFRLSSGLFGNQSALTPRHISAAFSYLRVHGAYFKQMPVWRNKYEYLRESMVSCLTQALACSAIDCHAINATSLAGNFTSMRNFNEHFSRQGEKLMEKKLN
jgi:hypothetical protein